MPNRSLPSDHGTPTAEHIAVVVTGPQHTRDRFVEALTQMAENRGLAPEVTRAGVPAHTAEQREEFRAAYAAAVDAAEGDSNDAEISALQAALDVAAGIILPAGPDPAAEPTPTEEAAPCDRCGQPVPFESFTNATNGTYCSRACAARMDTDVTPAE